MEILSSLFISPIISILICYITIYHSNKRNKEVLERQQRHHKENLDLAEKKFQEQLAINEENERLKHLPYLSIIPKYKENHFSAKIIKVDTSNLYAIPFDIVNKGAGSAFDIHLDYLDDDSSPLLYYNSPVAFQQSSNDHYDILGAHSPIDTDVLPMEDQTEFYLSLSAVNENSQIIEPNTTLRWEFQIIFSDVQSRKYSQKYSFYTSTAKRNITRINSEMPKLIEISNDI